MWKIVVKSSKINEMKFLISFQIFWIFSVTLDVIPSEKCVRPRKCVNLSNWRRWECVRIFCSIVRKLTRTHSSSGSHEARREHSEKIFFLVAHSLVRIANIGGEHKVFSLRFKIKYFMRNSRFRPHAFVVSFNQTLSV